MQFRLVTAFDAELANMVGAFIFERQTIGINALQIGIVDAPDMADGVRSDFAERIAAKQPGADFKTGKAETIDSKARDFL